MSTLYWFTVLGNLQRLFAVLVFFGTIFTAVLSIALIINIADDGDEKLIHLLKRFHKLSIVVWSISIFGVVFIPSTKELYAIYGIGTVVDFIKEDSVAKQLPRKAVVALDNWVESINKEQPENN